LSTVTESQARLGGRQWAGLRSEHAILGLLGAITLVGLLVRLTLLGDSLFGDELSTYFIVTESSLGHVVYLLEGGNSVDLNPPLFFILAWVAERFGESAELLRLPSLLAGVAAIPLTYLLGAKTIGRPAGVVGATLVALSPFLIFFSTEARAFALLMLLTLLSTIALLQAIETRRVGWWAAYAAFVCAAMYTQYTSVFLLAGQFLWAVWTQPQARRPLVVATLAAALAYAPWLPAVIEASDSPGVKSIEFLTPFGLDTIRVGLGRWSIGHPLTELKTVPGDFAVVMIAIGIALALAGLGWRAVAAVRSGPRLRPSPGLVLVLVVALATPVGEALYSWLGPHSVWGARQLNASTPGLALAVGALLTGSGARLRFLATGFVVIGFAIGAVKMLDSDVQRPDYAGVADFIADARAPGEPVLDVPLITPGPLTALEVALTSDGMPPSRQNPILRVGIPSRRAMLDAPPYAPLAEPPSETVVRQAERMARGRSLFVVLGLGGRPASLIVDALISQAGGRPVLLADESYPGLFPVTVYEYRLGSG
jgi:hypothetical protein